MFFLCTQAPEVHLVGRVVKGSPVLVSLQRWFLFRVQKFYECRVEKKLVILSSVHQICLIVPAEKYVPHQSSTWTERTKPFPRCMKNTSHLGICQRFSFKTFEPVALTAILPMSVRTRVCQSVPLDLEFYPTNSDIRTEVDESKWSDTVILEFSIILERPSFSLEWFGRWRIRRRLLVLRILGAW